MAEKSMIDVVNDARRDMSDIDEYNNSTDPNKVIRTRSGNTYKTHVGYIAGMLENGVGLGFDDLKELQSYTPSMPHALAKDLETKKIWCWKVRAPDLQPKWHDTGKSDLDLAKQSAADTYLPRFIFDKAKYFFALLAAKNQMTDLTLDNSGQFAEFVIDRWKERINSKNGISFASNTKYLLAFLDKNKLMTDLTLDNSGQFAEFVVKRLADRIAKHLNIDIDTTQPDEFVFNDAIQPVRPDLKKMALWGSSTLSMISGHLETAVRDLGITNFYAGAKGGERVEQISARMGSNPAKLKFTNGFIPVSGEAPVSVNWSAVRLMRAYEGVVNGVHGTLRIDYDTYQHYFKRTEDGQKIDVDPNIEFDMIPDAVSYRNSICIINVGKNNFSASTDNTAEFVLKRTDEMIRFLSPLYKYVIVVGHFNNTGANATSTQRVLDCNKGLLERYGPLFYDLQKYVMSEQIWLDTNISPTQNDLDQQESGQKPDSLSADYQHLNNAATKAVAAQLVNKIQQLKWLK